MNIQILPERVKKERENRNLSKNALAKQIGYTRQAISVWEKSENDLYIRSEVLGKLSNALGCTADYLTGKTDSKYTELQGDEEIKVLGISSKLQNTIREHIYFYSDEQLMFLNDFLEIIDISDTIHLLLFKKIFSSVLDISAITFSHPLNNWMLFKNSFRNTSSTLAKIKTELERQFPDSKLPKPLKNSLENCSKAFEKDYKQLSKPLRSERSLKESLKYIPDDFELFLKELKEQALDCKLKNLLVEAYSDAFDKAFVTDTEKLFRVLQRPFN